MKVNCFSYERADWTLIPEHCQHGLKLYIEHGIRPGSFMEAVLSNDLVEAFGLADAVNRHRIIDYVQFMYSYAPAVCWKSRKAVEDWIEQGGLYGNEADTRQEDAGSQDQALHDDSKVC